jgi:YVTN family beta-propeller protein
MANAQPFAYVTNAGSDNVSVVDTTTNTVVDTVSAGASPRAFGNFVGPTEIVRVELMSFKIE